MGYPCLHKHAIVIVFVPALKSVQVGTQMLIYYKLNHKIANHNKTNLIALLLMQLRLQSCIIHLFNS